jgi:hypothetical protein
MSIRKLAGLIRSPWFSYVTIFLLQLKIIWGIWRLRDLTSGDTSSYFFSAVDWFRDWHTLITWSPLYTAFYGTLLHLSCDAYAVTTLHRAIIVLALSILVLAVLRRLLPPGIAWMAAAWWVVLPIDFNTLYEVHLFAVIPVMIAFWAVLALPGLWGRGGGMAVLFAAAFLMRNELFPAVVLFAVLSIGWEALRLRRGAQVTRALLLAYVLPMAAAFLLIFVFYLRATDTAIIRPMLSRKHTLNVCQVYAFGYQQRHSDWHGSPWTECEQLMTRDFGVPETSLADAIRRNPRAMLENLWWEVQLAPNGIEVLMVNAMSGSANPDFAPVYRMWWALPVCLLMCVVSVAGLCVLYRDRQFWWRAWLKNRIWGWVAMACVTFLVPAIVLNSRPRPSYLLTFGIILRAVAGMSAFVLGRKFLQPKWFDSAVSVVAVLLVLSVPSFYALTNPSTGLAEAYRILSPYHAWVEAPGAGLVTTGWCNELCSYVGRSRSCRGFSYADLRRQVTPDVSFQRVLDNNRASVFLADGSALADPVARSFVANASSYGWRLIAMRRDGSRDWDLLVRSRSAISQLPAAPEPPEELGVDIYEPSSGVELGAGWYGFESFQGSFFRWANNDVEIGLPPAGASPVTLHFDVEPGPSLNAKPLDLQVFNGQDLLAVDRINRRQIVTIPLQQGIRRIRLHVASDNKVIPNDPRILNFRVFRIWIG